MNTTIHICFCSDEQLFYEIPTVINSIQSKNAHNTIVIHYIHNIINYKLIQSLEDFVKSFSNMKLQTYYKVWNKSYNGLKHVSNATMLRLFIPELIRESKVIYLDLDLIVQLDLQLLNSINCNPSGIALKESIQSPNGVTILQFKTKKSGNCGVMVMDLDILRKNNFIEKCLKIHEELGGHDQFIINMYTKDSYTSLPSNYNIFLNQDDDHLNQYDFILHFAGSKKPYLTDVGRYQYLWDTFAIDGITSNKSKKYGVLWVGAPSSNIGDDIQTLAAIEFLKLHNIHDYSLVNREELHSYNGKQLLLIMNGWFMHNTSNFPPSKKITPVFVSFHCARPELIAKNVNYFKKYEPIGCRDINTVKIFNTFGIHAYYTGCLTTLFPKSTEPKLLTITTEPDLIAELQNKNIHVDLYLNHYALKNSSILNNQKKRIEIAKQYIELYKKAKLVITSKLHCALPCRAMGIPVIFVHSNYHTDPRFTGNYELLHGSDKLSILEDSIDYKLINEYKQNFMKYKLG